MKTKLFGLATLALALTACGNGDDEQGPYGTYQGSLGTQGYCDAQVVDMYNTFAYECNQLQAGMRTQREARQCLKAAKDFVRVYPNISCVALLQDDFNQPNHPNRRRGGFDYNDQYNTQFQGQRAMTITSQPMYDEIARLEQFRQGNRNWYNGRRDWYRVRGQ